MCRYLFSKYFNHFHFVLSCEAIFKELASVFAGSNNKNNSEELQEVSFKCRSGRQKLVTFNLNTKTNPSMAFASHRILLILLIQELFLLLTLRQQSLGFSSYSLCLTGTVPQGRVLVFSLSQEHAVIAGAWFLEKSWSLWSIMLMTWAIHMHTLPVTVCMCFGKGYLGGEWKRLNPTYFNVSVNQMLVPTNSNQE